MCGIFCALARDSTQPEDRKLVDHTKNLLQNRGPDSHSEHQIECNDFVATFHGYVLWQQGTEAATQPMTSGDHVMLFNGDIYSTEPLTPKLSSQSDTEWLFAKIIECNEESEFFDLLKLIQGPYSLIYFNGKTKRLYFARDSLGRQTLLIGSHKNSIYITSVASKAFGIDSFLEVPPIGIFCLNLCNSECDLEIRLNTSVPNAVTSCNHPKVGILFSGGIDCTILAILADKFIDKATAIDLINVSFEKIVRNQSTNKQHTETYETPDRLTSRETLNELIHLCPERKWNLIEVNVTREELKDAVTQRISDLCYPLNSVLDESLGAALWFAASAK